MNVEYHRFYSHYLGKDMELKSYGSHGKPVVVFPSSGVVFMSMKIFKWWTPASLFWSKAWSVFIR